MSVLTIDSASGILTVQDMGRPGHLGEGLSRGGAMDRRALLEAAALLGATAPLAGIEMAGAGGSFSVDVATRIALTGAPMGSSAPPASADPIPMIRCAARLSSHGSVAIPPAGTR